VEHTRQIWRVAKVGGSPYLATKEHNMGKGKRKRAKRGGQAEIRQGLPDVPAERLAFKVCQVGADVAFKDKHERTWVLVPPTGEPSVTFFVTGHREIDLDNAFKLGQTIGFSEGLAIEPPDGNA